MKLVAACAGVRVLCGALLLASPLQAGADPWMDHLCGLWLTDPAQEPVSYEHWWWQGDELHGEGGRWQSGQRVAHEQMRLVPVTNNTFDYHAQPQGQPETVFFVSAEQLPEARRWLNAAHDFPQLIRYRLSETELTASVSRQHDDALAQAQHWHYTRQQGCQSAATLP